MRVVHREPKQAPRPERRESELPEPGRTGLSARDYRAIVVRAAKEALDDGITDIAAALAYYAFLAIPSVLLVVLGVFGLFASPDAVSTLAEKLAGVVPAEAIALLEDSLDRIIENRSGGGAMVAVGAVLALWSSTGAMNALMRGLNVAYDRKETRGFVRQRLTALTMLACLVAAFLLVFGLLVLGPVLSKAIGDLLGLETAFRWIWWTAQWPILLGGLLLVFTAVLYLGPNVEERRWRALALGSGFAVFVWLAASGLFAVYVSNFGSYNKAWGSVAAVIVMLTWLWLSALAILFGAEVNAEARRTRGEPPPGPGA